jgi:hypothetical protein
VLFPHGLLGFLLLGFDDLSRWKDAVKLGFVVTTLFLVSVGPFCEIHESVQGLC